MTRSGERTTSTVIGVGRIVWGAVAVVAPGAVHRALGAHYPGEDRGVWIRAFGVRDIAMGMAALHSDSAVRRLMLDTGVAIDLFDAAVVLDAGRRGLNPRAVGVGLAMAGGTATFGLLGPTLLGR